ncbi:MAG: hypothetical protein K2M95_03540 [Clostridiales bacterium]|nr:hypothetical protein [Clostridiales bacterium]
MVRIEDAGNPSDDGIWFPVAIKVDSTAPISANPVIDGKVGESFYLSPLGVTSTGGTTFAVGSYIKEQESELGTDALAENGTADETKKGKVIPLATSYDNYSYVTTSRTLSGITVENGGGAAATIDATAAGAATNAQRMPIFLGRDAVNGWLYGNNTPDASVAHQYSGFKQFFTVETVKLYASTAVLGGLSDADIATLVGAGVIKFTVKGGNQYVEYTGLKITLNKWTKNLYLSIMVNVFDANERSSNIHVAVKVQNSVLTSANERGAASGKKPFNTRGEVMGSAVAEAQAENSAHAKVFKFRMLVGQTLYISPYDLFYENDTYAVNVNGSDKDNGKYFNTVPGSDGYIDLIQNIYAGINVYASADATTVPTALQSIQFEDLRVGNTTPTVSGVYFGNVTYIANHNHAGLSGINGSTDGNSSLGGGYFAVKATSKSGSGCISFTYEVIGSSGDTVSATVEIYVLNSLPVIRRGADVVTGDGELDVPLVFNLTAQTKLEYVNSSSQETRLGSGIYNINSNTYNVREFKLTDLFKDLDGDIVKLADGTGIEVGTKDVKGNFIKFDNGLENVFILAQIGSGSNNRLGDNNCIILTGLSSTQGLPGGLWIRLSVTDNAIGTGNVYVQYCFQVEVYNSVPEYAELTGDNMMELAPLDSADETSPLINTWTVESDDATAIRNNQIDIDGIAVTSVARPLYIAANADSMVYLQNSIQSQAGNNGYSSAAANFKYNSTQVRYIARDPDQGQSLSLTSQNFMDGAIADSTNAPNVKVGNGFTGDNKDAVVLVNDFYGITGTSHPGVSVGTYYANYIVRLHFFDKSGNEITLDGVGADATSQKEVVNKMFTATNWVIEFSFTSSFKTKMVVKLRLRDSNLAVTLPANPDPDVVMQPATQGGWAKTDVDGNRISYSGVRELNNDGTAFVAKAEVTDSAQTFEFAVNVRGKGLINNFSRWITNEEVTNTGNGSKYSLNGVWTATAKDGTTHYLHEQETNIDGTNVFRYRTVEVGASNTVTLPVSYFAWAADTTTAANAGSTQGNVAWFNLSSAGTVNSFNIGSIDNIASCLSLSDGYNTWSGAMGTYALANNPYIRFGVNDAGSTAITSPYLSTQRFTVTDEGTFVMLKSDGSNVYVEDTHGITLTKKDIRSVGTLTLTVNMVPWAYKEGRYEIDSSDAEDKSQKVIVPISVANNTLSLNETTITKDISGASTSLRVALSNNNADSFPTGTATFKGTTVDQYTANNSVIGTTRYREDLYFMAHSISGNFTEEELAYITGGDALKTTGVDGRLLSYFGVTTLADAVDSSTKLLSSSASVNKKYSNYFTVSPSGVDSQTITITPVRSTKFNTSGMTAAQIATAAEERGLSYDAVSGKIYYALRLLVYDKLYIGTLNNSTAFTESSIDVVTINLTIGNTTPTIQTASFTGDFTVAAGQTLPRNGFSGDKATANIAGTYKQQLRLLTQTVGESVEFRFTDVFTDADMVETKHGGQSSYMYKEEIEALSTSTDETEKLQYDTADYLMIHDKTSSNVLVDKEHSELRVLVRFMTADGRIISGTTPDRDPNGAVRVEVGNDSFKISVDKRRSDLKSSNEIAATVMVAFMDSEGAFALAFYEVHIDNQAPYLTEYAQAVSEIEMYTNQYFTLYTTPYASIDNRLGFIDGTGSTTVGTYQNGAYTGTYFTQMPEGSSAQPKASFVYNENLEHTQIGQPGYASTAGPDGAKDNAASHDPDNLGYMAIAHDDTPWSLRITNYTSSVSDSYIKVTRQNYVYWEGQRQGVTPASELSAAPTAIMFKAMGACNNAQFSVTLYDGNGGRYVTYNFRITVKSTVPEPIARSTNRAGVELGSSLKAAGLMPVAPTTENAATHELDARYANTLSFGDVGGFSTADGNKKGEYVLKMYVGQKLQLKTSDFAYDIDYRDTDKMYLLNRNGNNPFTVLAAGQTGDPVSTYSTACILLTPVSAGGARSTAFTIEATNFHNNTGDDASRKYDTVTFYICDNSAADLSKSVCVTLKVYVFPNEITRKTSGTNAKSDVRVLGITDYLEQEAPTVVKLVSTSTAAEQGLMIDDDAEATQTRYQVKVYTMFDPQVKAGESVSTIEFKPNDNNRYATYEEANFKKLRDDAGSASDTSANSNAILSANEVVTYSAGGTLTIGSGSGQKILSQYIESITFANNGTVMRITPKKATNNLYAIDGSGTGIKLFISVQKVVSRGSNIDDYGPKFASRTENNPVKDTCDVVANVTVGNSAPIAVGDTARNFNYKVDGLPYLTFEGVKGEKVTYRMCDPTTTRDAALFTDPDGDNVIYGGIAVTRMYTVDIAENEIDENLDAIADNRNGKSITYRELGRSAINPTFVNVTLEDGTSAVELTITILNKIVLPDEAKKSRTVYLEVEVRGYDLRSTEYVTTTVTLGIRNDTPTWKSEDKVADKYKSVVSQNSYVRHSDGGVDMTLTLCKDDTTGLISKNGTVTIPLIDLLDDKDYEAGSTQEWFAFPAEDLLDSTPSDPLLTEINREPTATIGIDRTGKKTVITSANVSDKAVQCFLITVSDTLNTNLNISVNSYERGTRVTVAIILMDTTGAMTSTLRLTLVVGNSTPIDKTRTDDGVSSNIVLAGGKTGNADLNGMFEATTYSLFDFVTDNNPKDCTKLETNADGTERAPEEAQTYLRIMDYLASTPVFDPASEHEDYIVDDMMGGPVSQVSSKLVEFLPYQQKFTIAPLPKLYGSQTITLRISDIGNSNDTAASSTIELRLDIQVTKNPDDMTTNTVKVYWKRTKAITAKELFDDPSTTDLDESKGLIVEKLSLVDPGQASMVEIANPRTNTKSTGSLTATKAPLLADPTATFGAPTIRGAQRSGDSTIKVKATVVVGSDAENIADSATRYDRVFDVVVADNLQPKMLPGYDPKCKEVHYVNKADFTDADGSIFRLKIDQLLWDEEQDPIQLESAKSKKSTLIEVTADRQNNELVFHFKSKGTSTITVQASDAVSTYNYTFLIGNNDLHAPNFFVAMISRIQDNPLIYIIIALAIILLLIILIAIIATVRKKKRMREEIEALLVSEMELEEQMLKLAASPSPTYYQSYGYLPPTQNVQQPGFMLGQGQSMQQPNPQAIGLNPGSPNMTNTNPGVQSAPNPIDDMSDDDL